MNDDHGTMQYGVAGAVAVVVVRYGVGAAALTCSIDSLPSSYRYCRPHSLKVST